MNRKLVSRLSLCIAFALSSCGPDKSQSISSRRLVDRLVSLEYVGQPGWRWALLHQALAVSSRVPQSGLRGSEVEDCLAVEELENTGRFISSEYEDGSVSMRSRFDYEFEDHRSQIFGYRAVGSALRDEHPPADVLCAWAEEFISGTNGHWLEEPSWHLMLGASLSEMLSEGELRERVRLAARNLASAALANEAPAACGATHLAIALMLCEKEGLLDPSARERAKFLISYLRQRIHIGLEEDGSYTRMSGLHSVVYQMNESDRAQALAHVVELISVFSLPLSEEEEKLVASFADQADQLLSREQSSSREIGSLCHGISGMIRIERKLASAEDL
jgi:hypothetical protein